MLLELLTLKFKNLSPVFSVCGTGDGLVVQSTAPTITFINRMDQDWFRKVWGFETEILPKMGLLPANIEIDF